MTGNKDQLEDFEEFNGGSVTFGGSKGYIDPTQGPISGIRVDDPLASLVQGLVTPSTTKVNASGEEQVEDISPNTLASLKPRSIDKGRRYKRRKEVKGKKVVSSLDFQEEVDAGVEQVNTAKGVNTGSIKLRLVTPPTTKVNASGEEQVEDISPNTLASLKPRSIDKGRRYKRRKEAKEKKVVSRLDFQEEVDAGAEQVNTAKGVNTGSIKLSTVSEQLSTGNEQVSTVGAKKSTSSADKGQREGKAPMLSEETPKKSKEQILQEEASLAKAIRLDSVQNEEEA
ncbi:hypothetical protein Tco_0028209, partial [Tanacetum coccineum]